MAAFTRRPKALGAKLPLQMEADRKSTVHDAVRMEELKKKREEGKETEPPRSMLSKQPCVARH